MLITILSIMYLLFTGCYALWIILLILGLARLNARSNDWQPHVSVIIPARNEAENIAKCLRSVMNQTYPTELFEAIVVDDRSEDNTAEIVDALTKTHPNLKLFRLDPHIPFSASPKKQAIQTGISHSSGDVILTTDADCIVLPTWISTIIGQFDAQTGVVCGWVRLEKSAGLFSQLQSLEAFGLVAAGAGSIGLGRPLIANAANLAYRRSVFDQVGGFSGIDHLASGDDDLLIQKIYRETQWKVGFAPQVESVVQAKPAVNLREFFHQRLRWASKARHYKSISVVLSLCLVYVYFLLLLLGIPLCLTFRSLCLVFILSLIVKLVSDYLLSSRALGLIGEKVKLLEFFLGEVGQIIYVLVVGPCSLIRGFEWKDRVYSKLFLSKKTAGNSFHF